MNRIYIVEFCPQNGENCVCVQTMKPFHWVKQHLNQFKGGIKNLTIRPLVLNGRFLTYANGKVEILWNK